MEGNSLWLGAANVFEAVWVSCGVESVKGMLITVRTQRKEPTYQPVCRLMGHTTEEKDQTALHQTG